MSTDMRPSAEERLREALPRTAFPMILPSVVEQAYRDGAAAERAKVLALLREPTSQMLNQAADDLRRGIDPLQAKAKYLLEGVADEIEKDM